MARFRGSITTEGEITLAAATAKTILLLQAPANHRVALLGFAVSFDGVSSSEEPVQVTVLRTSTGGTMTAATEYKDDSSLSETLQSAGFHTATAEPTAGDILRRYNVHPQAGFERVFGIDEEIIIPGGGRLAIRCTAPSTVRVTGHMFFEE